MGYTAAGHSNNAATVGQVDEEVMTLQKASLQRGEKFKESEVRPRPNEHHPCLHAFLRL